MKFKKIELPFKTNALEPYIDELTVSTHYNKHHFGYESKFNEGIKGTKLENYNSIEELMLDYKNIPEEYRTLTRNAGGGLINHNFYWNQFSINREINNNEIENKKMIIEQFGTIESFKNEVTKKGLSLFGSGWVWAIINNGKIEIITTPNQENPWMQGISNIILGIDVWEHSYYLKYKSNRKDYIDNIWNLLPYN